jgi:hypothetical protein
MNNPQSLPTPEEILTAVQTLAKVSRHIDSKPIRDAVKMFDLSEGGLAEEQAEALWTLNEDAVLALRNFSEAVCLRHARYIDSYLANGDFAEAHALRLYRRASCELMCAIDDAQDVANERYIQMIGEENPQTEADYNSCSDHE